MSLLHNSFLQILLRMCLNEHIKTDRTLRDGHHSPTIMLMVNDEWLGLCAYFFFYCNDHLGHMCFGGVISDHPQCDLSEQHSDFPASPTKKRHISRTCICFWNLFSAWTRFSHLQERTGLESRPCIIMKAWIEWRHSIFPFLYGHIHLLPDGHSGPFWMFSVVWFTMSLQIYLDEVHFWVLKLTIAEVVPFWDPKSRRWWTCRYLPKIVLA